jgi:hypothetical protein
MNKHATTEDQFVKVFSVWTNMRLYNGFRLTSEANFISLQRKVKSDMSREFFLLNTATRT